MSPYLILYPFLALIGPFFLWPFERLLPYPYIFEEIFKVVAIYYLLSTTLSNHKKLYLTILFALLFTFSESIFYYINFVGFNLGLIIPRLILTFVLHTTTSLIILGAGIVNKKLIVGGLFLAVLIHYFYNLKIDSLLSLYL